MGAKSSALNPTTSSLSQGSAIASPLSLSILICKIGIVTLSTLQSEKLNKVKPVLPSAGARAHREVVSKPSNYNYA